MPSLKKLLSKINKQDRESVKFLVEKIVSSDWRDLNIKKLKKYQNIFRVRKGKFRVIFSKEKKEIFIITIERRSENTYKFKT
jgi:mRNA-degrading endonuclease RelE of RelBE toxin-antitoxin system